MPKDNNKRDGKNAGFWHAEEAGGTVPEFLADAASEDVASKQSPDDTSGYLLAAMESRRQQEESHQRKSVPRDAAGHRSAMDHDDSDDLGKYQDVSRYRASASKRRRSTVLRAAIITAVVLLVGAAAAVTFFVHDINTRLTQDVTTELRDELKHSEPGDPFYLLLLGVDKDQSRWEGDDSEDYGADEHNYRSDSIMLCRIDPKEVKVTMVSIHRDTLINMGEYGQQKINASYAFGGSAYATQVVSEFAGVDIAHYAEVDLDRFISIVDVVGGVTVNLPVPVYDPEFTKLDLPAGEQTLNGLEAALLCRCRHGYDEYGDGDRFRAANQRMVFTEIIKKVLASDPATIVATITTMADSVTTDLDLAAILDLAGQMQHLDVNTDIMTGMEPTEGVYLNGGWYEVCITDQWQKMMQRVNQGLPPYDEEAGEYDSTAGIAGAVGQSGAQAADRAVANDNAEAAGQTTTSTTTPAPAPDPEPTPAPAPEPDYVPEAEPVYQEEYYYDEGMY